MPSVRCADQGRADLRQSVHRQPDGCERSTDSEAATIGNQSANATQALRYQFASNTFADVDAGQTLTYGIAVHTEASF